MKLRSALICAAVLVPLVSVGDVAAAAADGSVISVDTTSANRVTVGGFAGRSQVTISFSDGAGPAPCDPIRIPTNRRGAGAAAPARCDMRPGWKITATDGEKKATVIARAVKIVRADDASDTVSVGFDEDPSGFGPGDFGCGGRAFVTGPAGTKRFVVGPGLSLVDFSTPGPCRSETADDTTADLVAGRDRVRLRLLDRDGDSSTTVRSVQGDSAERDLFTKVLTTDRRSARHRFVTTGGLAEFGFAGQRSTRGWRIELRDERSGDVVLELAADDRVEAKALLDAGPYVIEVAGGVGRYFLITRSFLSRVEPGTPRVKTYSQRLRDGSRGGGGFVTRAGGRASFSFLGADGPGRWVIRVVALDSGDVVETVRTQRAVKFNKRLAPGRYRVVVSGDAGRYILSVGYAA